MRARLFAIIRKEAIHIRRDPRTLGLTFVMPLAMLLLLGYAVQSDVRHLPLAVWDQDRSAESRALLEAYLAPDYFELRYEAGSDAELEQLIAAGDAHVGMIIPPGYGEAISSGRTSQVAFVIDGSDPVIAQTALAAAAQLGQAASVGIIEERLDATGQGGMLVMPVEVRTQVWYNPDLRSSHFMIPALIGVIMLFLSVVLTSTAIVRERERGTIEQLIVTPVRSWELLVGKLTPYILLAFLNTVEILVIGVLLFGVPVAGSVALLLICCAIFLVTPLGIGLLISTVAKSQQEAIILSLFFLLPNIFLSGYMFPIAAMPEWLQALTNLFPLSFFLTIVRGIILRGAGVADLYPQILALVVYGVAVMTLAASRFRKRLD
ncbi:MAG: drug efflux transport system permease protein [Chloroflexota bacterium]|nr:drug efflux transport system permease protein [Chloroflexota bacterium]